MGGASVLSPVYISEVSPPKLRRRLLATSQFAIVLGILVAFFVNFMVDNTGVNNWRWMFLSGVFPSIIFIALLFFITRSPRWLIKTGRVEEARSVIKKVNPYEDIDELVVDIEESIRIEESGKKINILKKPYFRLILIGFAVGMFNQLSGINIIMYYSTDIFRTAGFSGESGRCIFAMVYLLLALQKKDLH